MNMVAYQITTWGCILFALVVVIQAILRNIEIRKEYERYGTVEKSRKESVQAMNQAMNELWRLTHAGT